MAKTQPRKPLKDRTPIGEWAAAATGVAMTVGVIGYSLWEGLASSDDRPSLTVEAGAPEPTGGRYLVPIVVRNQAHATAAAVEVRGELRTANTIVEARRMVFTYVPGKGEARGGLLFDHSPAGYALHVTPEGYEEP